MKCIRQENISNKIGKGRYPCMAGITPLELYCISSVQIEFSELMPVPDL